MKKAKIIATGGMSRSGTNYLNYYFALHSKIRPLSYVSGHEIGKWFPTKKKVTVQRFFDRWNREERKPIPFYKELADSDFSDARDFHRQQFEKIEFDAISFKADMGEGWFSSLIPKMKDKIAIVYAMRNPVENYAAWKRWNRYQRTDLNEVWLRAFKKSVADAYLLFGLYSANEIYFMPINISAGHDEICDRLRKVLNRWCGFTEENFQGRFINRRRRLASNISFCEEREESDDDLRSELIEVDSEFPIWEDRYLKLTNLVLGL